MRYTLLLAAASLVLAAASGCSGCHAEMHTETTPPPAASPAESAPPPVASAEAPEPVAVRSAQVEGTRVRIPHELEFAVDKSTFDENKDPNKEILATLLEFLQKNTHVTKLRIEGHTDNTGKSEHNKDLSQQRADAVAKWLIAHGIDASRIKTVGFGDSKPEVPNDSDAHRSQNRRTEFHVDEVDGKPHVPHHRHHDGGAPPAASASGSPASKP